MAALGSLLAQRVSNPILIPSRIDFDGFFSAAANKPGKSFGPAESRIFSHSFGRIRSFELESFSSSSARLSFPSSELCVTLGTFILDRADFAADVTASFEADSESFAAAEPPPNRQPRLAKGQRQPSFSYSSFCEASILEPSSN